MFSDPAVPPSYATDFAPIVSSRLLRIGLCRVIPDNENEVLNKVPSENTRCYLAFGEYDLVLISECEDIESIAAEVWHEYAPSLLEYEEIICFGWEGFSWPLARFKNLSTYGPARAISLLKLNDQVTSELGVWAEGAVCQWLANSTGDEDVPLGIPYGNLGWPELVVMWAADSYNSIVEHLIKLRSLTLDDVSDYLGKRFPDRLEGQELPLLSFSHSLPIAKISNGDDPYDPSALLAAPDSLHAQIMVVTAINADNWVQQKLSAELKHPFKVTPTYGYYDLQVAATSEPISLHDLAGALKEIRRLSPFVRSTDVRFAEPGSDDEANNSLATGEEADATNDDVESKSETTGDSKNGQKAMPPRVENHTIPESLKKQYQAFLNAIDSIDKLERKIDNSFVRLAPELNYAAARYYALRSRPEYASLLEDLNYILQGLLNNASSIVTEPLKRLRYLDEEIRHEYDDIHFALRIFHYLLEQRLSGATLGLANAKNEFTRIRSAGIQRLLRASQAVPRSVLKGAEFEDDTVKYRRVVTIFGFDNHMSRISHDVFNLPSATAFDPTKWWSLGHEAGHQLSDYLRITENQKIKTTVESVASSLRQENEPGNRYSLFINQEAIRNFSEELIADAFSFHFACGEDWETYVETTWSFLEQYLEGLGDIEATTGYLLRSTFIFFYFLEAKEGLEVRKRVSSMIERGQALRGHLYTPTKDEAVYAETAQSLKRNLRYRSFARYTSLPELIEEFLKPEILKHTDDISDLIATVDSDTIAYWYEKFEPLRSLLLRIFTDFGNEFRHERPSIHTHEETREELINGKLCIESATQPFDVILALKKEKTRRHTQGDETAEQAWTKATLATILSLWHLDCCGFTPWYAEKPIDSGKAFGDTATA